MPVISLGPDQDSYYVNNGLTSRWCNLPLGLGESLKNDDDFSTEKIISLTVFTNGGYFLKATGHTLCSNLPASLRALLAKHRLDVNRDVKSIQYDACNPDRWLVRTKNGGLVHQNLPQGLLDSIAQSFGCYYGADTILALGYANSYVFTWRDRNGVLQKRWCLPDSLDQYVERQSLKSVTLSPARDTHLVAFYNDGKMGMSLRGSALLACYGVFKGH